MTHDKIIKTKVMHISHAEVISKVLSRIPNRDQLIISHISSN